jgi:hypothetical protein
LFSRHRSSWMPSFCQTKALEAPHFQEFWTFMSRIAYAETR